MSQTALISLKRVQVVDNLSEASEVSSTLKDLDSEASITKATYRQCTIDNFRLLEINSQGRTSFSDEVKADIKNIFRAESCARILLAGTREQLEELSSLPAVRNLDLQFSASGQDAYHYLLRLAVGLESVKKGEEHVLGQLQSRWYKFESENRNALVSIQRIMQDLFTDAKLVRKNILDNVKVPRLYSAVRELLDLKGTERILLIADGEKSTRDAAWNIAGSSKHRARELIVTHMSATDLDTQYKILERERTNRRVLSDLTAASLQNVLSAGFEQFDHVVVNQSMASQDPNCQHGDLAVDRLIISAWQERSLKRADGSIVHVVGNLNAKGVSEPHWNVLEGRGFISQEKVRATLNGQKDRLEEVLNRAAIACSNLTNARSKNPDFKLTKADTVRIFSVPSGNLDT